MSGTAPDDGGSLVDYGRLLEVCDCFETAWRAGSRPQIEAYLGAVGAAERAALFDQLLAVEIDLRRQAGERPLLGEYRDRFPEFQPQLEAMFAGLTDPEPSAVESTLRDEPATEPADDELVCKLACHNGLVEPSELEAARRDWESDGSQPLGFFLVERGVLEADQLMLLEALQAELLKRHGGDRAACLAALGNNAPTVQQTAQTASTDLDATATYKPSEASTLEAPESTVSAPGSHTDSSSGRFRILKPYARGSLGEVYVAQDEELHREVALKEIQSYHAHRADSRARFILEAEITGRLEHPGIVPVYGLGYYQDGRPFYAMRFIRGETLKEAITRHYAPESSTRDRGTQSLEMRQLLRRFVDVCNAIAYAHGRRILHRDLKPGNILLGPYGETLIVDWGLAKPVDRPESLDRPPEGTLKPASEVDSAESAAGSVIGTPAYMSPEQAEGRIQDVGPASDVYNLGATLYCILTGHAPFESGDTDTVLRLVATGAFKKPRQVNPKVPAALEAICLKAMALKPSNRYESAKALADDLDRWLADESVAAYREPPHVRLGRWMKRHKPVIAAAATVLLCAVVGLAFYSIQIGKEKARVEAARAEAEANLAIARSAVNQMIARVAGPDLAYLPRTEGVRLAMAGQVTGLYQQLLKKYPHDPRVRLDAARAFHTAGNVGRTTGQVKFPGESYKQAIDLLNELAREDPAQASYRFELAETLIDQAEHLRMTGHSKDGEATLQEALKITERLAKEDAENAGYRRSEAKVLIDLAAVREDIGKDREALESSNQAVAVLTPLASRPRAERLDQILLIYALRLQGSARRRLHDTGGAEQALGDAVKKAKGLVTVASNRDTQFALATAYVEQAELFREAGKPQAESMTAYNEGGKLLAKLVGSYSDVPFYLENLARVLNGRGACLLTEKRLPQAEADLTKARSYLEKIVATPRATAENQSLLAETLANLGRLARAKGKQDEARELLKQAVARFETSLQRNPDNPGTQALARRCRDELRAIDGQ